MRFLLRSLGVLAALMWSLSLLAAPVGNVVDKFALVIGNRDYANPSGTLGNTLRDAESISQSLRKLGFKVTERNNLNRSMMLSEIADFAERLPTGATALVYYAGHGMQVGGANYLVPVDMALTSEQTVPIKAYSLKTLLERLSASKSAVNIVVLDACRNNPFQPPNAIRYRNFANLGLASIRAPRGTLIAYSTAPGQLAADGKEANSLYSATLAKVMVEPQLEIREVFEKVGNMVRKRTLDDQIPWYETSLTEKYYFLPPEGVSIVAGKPLNSAYAQSAGSNAGPYRGSNSPSTALLSANWFANLTSTEWDTLHWEIQQRSRRITADEIPKLEHKATGGSLVAQVILGIAYREGVEKAVDPSSGKVMRYQASNRKALKWLRKAADANFPIAQVELGEMYYAGQGVDRNLTESGRWLEAAALSNYTRARLDLMQLQVEAALPGANPMKAHGRSRF
jgi:hypothetical protein